MALAPSWRIPCRTPAGPARRTSDERRQRGELSLGWFGTAKPGLGEPGPLALRTGRNRPRAVAPVLRARTSGPAPRPERRSPPGPARSPPRPGPRPPPGGGRRPGRDGTSSNPAEPGRNQPDGRSWPVRPRAANRRARAGARCTARVDVGHQVVGHHEVDQSHHVVQRRPGRERQPRRSHFDAMSPQGDHHLRHVGHRVALSRTASMRSLTDSKALTTKAQPASASSGSTSG